MNQHKKVYFISGLGADKRIFSLLDLSFCSPVFLDWLTPSKNESLAGYARRLRQEIPESSPSVVGISFGGMLATEMAKADPKIRAVILASNKTSSEFPYYFKIARLLPVYKLAPPPMAKKIAIKYQKILGGLTAEKKKILNEIIQDADLGFVRWAIGAILKWKNKVIPENLVHIHGTADKLLPCKYVEAHFRVEGGTHVMPLDQADEVSALLRQLF